MTFTRNGAASPSGIEIVVGDNNADLDVYQVQDATGSLMNGPDFSTLDEIRSGIYLRDGDQTAFNSTTLPLAPPSLAPFNDSASSPNFNVNQFEIMAILRNRSILFIVSGPVAHITVPEPSTPRELISGLIAVVIGYTQHRKK